MRGKIIFALSIFTLVAIFAVLRERRAPEVETRARVKHSPEAASTPGRTPAADPAAEAPPAVLSAATADPQFQRWIETEAKSLDAIKTDGDAKEREIREIVRKITPSQARQLRQTVIHPRSKPREKILSAYLLVEGGLNTREELREAITAPLRESGGEAHSEEELKGVREKSVRIMLIDGLVAQAQSDAQARASLAKAINDSEDPYIKSYARRRFDELPPLRSEL